MEKLFDILVCQCKFSEGSGCPKDCKSAHIECFCARKFKIPIKDLSFIKDQREKVGHNSGKMVIYGSKQVVAQKLLKKKKSKNEEEQRLESKQSENYSEEDDPEREPMDYEEQDDPMYVPKKESYNSNETTTDLTYFIAECVRYTVSERAAAALYNAALHTMGELQEYHIVDN